MAIALVNTAAAGNTAASASTIATAATSLTAGNRIQICARWSNGSSITGVADTAGNTYVLVHQQSSAFTTLAAYECDNCLGHASNVVTVTWAAGVADRSLTTVQWSGSGTYTRAAVSWATVAAFTSTDITVPVSFTGDDLLVVAWVQVDATGGTWTPGADLTKAVEDASTVLLTAYAIVTSSDTIAVAASSTSNQGKLGIAAVWLPPAGGSSGGGEHSAVFIG